MDFSNKFLDILLKRKQQHNKSTQIIFNYDITVSHLVFFLLNRTPDDWIIIWIQLKFTHFVKFNSISPSIHCRQVIYLDRRNDISIFSFRIVNPFNGLAAYWYETRLVYYKLLYIQLMNQIQYWLRWFIDEMQHNLDFNEPRHQNVITPFSHFLPEQLEFIESILVFEEKINDDYALKLFWCGRR